ncbi:MAG: tRNA preQ1(34) S-adenosylmethionine ribosyltransferase-isomerase QueA [Treponema sp.]
MNLHDFYFELPPSLIAQSPSKVRGEDRLLVLNKTTGTFNDEMFSSLPELLPKNAVLVFNNSKVRHSRLFGKEIGSNTSIEFLLIKTLDDGSTWEMLSPKMKKLKIGTTFSFAENVNAKIIAGEKNDKFLQFEKSIDDAILEKIGHVPLPPYIKREDTNEDASRYQTIYANVMGSIACPTAGLHFTEPIIEKIKMKGIDVLYVTLHVGLGTFLPVREEKIEEHKMHKEDFFISEDVASFINEAKKQGRPIIACGTTSARTLEAAWNVKEGKLESGDKSTDIFIYPPYKFNVVDALITNFHTPESTLLMLVSALCSREKILNAYQHAIEKSYRFFSYGDAMLII